MPVGFLCSSVGATRVVNLEQTYPLGSAHSSDLAWVHGPVDDILKCGIQLALVSNLVRVLATFFLSAPVCH